MARVLSKYLTVKLNIYLGRLCLTLDHIEVVLEIEYFKIDEIIESCESSSWLILSSCFV